MKLPLSIFIFIIITGCGFKIANFSNLENYNITNVETKGESKINFIVKNLLLRSSNNENVNNLSISINTVLDKDIKEKNIKNEITKYQLIINSEIKLLNPKNNNEISFRIKKSGTFNVADQNSTTRNNEKQLISMLSNELAKEIIKETNILLNDI